MENNFFHLSQKLASQICSQLTRTIPIQSFRKQLICRREKTIESRNRDYLHDTFQSMREMEFLQPDKSKCINEVTNQLPKIRNKNAKLSILKVRREEKSQGKQLQRRRNSKFPHNQIRRRQLVKLHEQEEQALKQEDKFIELMRKKKQKYALAMENFQKDQIQTVQKVKRNEKHVTNYSGEKLQPNKKQIIANIERIKIKPNILINPSFSESTRKSLKQSQELIGMMKEDIKQNMVQMSTPSIKSDKEKFQSFYKLMESTRNERYQRRRLKQ